MNNLRISRIDLTPLYIPYKHPFHWAKGVIHGAEVILIAIHSEGGVIGYGECIASPKGAVESYLRTAADLCTGRDAWRSAALMQEVTHSLFQACGTCSSPRFAARITAGLEMAMWDVVGKAASQPVHHFFGGKLRDHIDYFGFAQGETPEEVAADAHALKQSGHKVIYVKVGRGDTLDIETVAKVREAIGDARLRLDANESWSGVGALKLIRDLTAFDIEFIEQPTNCESISALARLRQASPIAIAADQAVFTPFDTYELCRQDAADAIVIGLHEAGGLRNLAKIAAIAEAAGLDVCLHGLYETGITAIATSQVAATIPNLDDGNQHMTRFLEWDIVSAPSLDLGANQGRLPVADNPGLGFELDGDAVERANTLYLEQNG